MKRYLAVPAALTILILSYCAPKPSSSGETSKGLGSGIAENPDRGKVADGQRIFRFDTFGDEQFWTDTLHLNQVVETAVDPTTALKVGLKVDAEALPPGILAKVDLKSPATTVALLKLNAVVGVQATVDSNNHITRLGITCALCHSTVDNSAAPGIGRRLDGHPNRDLNVGAIIALSPALTAVQKGVYSSWGPGRYDPRYNIDGKNTPLVLPPAYGLASIRNETYTAEGPISYWNAYVAVTQMHGHGNFSDQRLGINITQTPDLVTSKLPALREYQHSLPAPSPAADSFDRDAARRGQVVFGRSCASCHVGGSGTDNNTGVLHKAEETGMDGAYAARTPSKAYRTTPLRGLLQHPPYFHDGSAATLAEVVAHYDKARHLNLTAEQQRDLVEYLKSL
ncbi:MAG TPA: c-type cytochrome [Gemmatimonadales bacterium]|jgi:cytochrome c2|nr:c-type cytochrome [Gemmatimonadales bacterium]